MSQGNAVTTVKQAVVTKVVSSSVVAGTAQGIPGPPGPPGTAGSVYIQLPTNSAVSGHRVVFADSGVAAYASCYDRASAISAIGITARAETANMPVDVQTSGEMVEPSWNWQPGFVFLGDGGVLTQNLPSDALVSLIVARVIEPTRILIQVGRPVVKA